MDADQSVSARRWPQKLSPADRERVLLEVLDGGWMDTRTVHIAARNREPSFKVAPGTTRGILDRLAAAGRCESNGAGWFRGV